MKKFAPIVFALLGGCATSLTHYDGYRGDGLFASVPAPSALCQDGYTVDLGPVALDQADYHVRKNLDGLPHIESMLGVALEATADNAGASALITLTLRDEHDHIVLSLQNRLSEWTRLHAGKDPRHAFAYQPGRLIDVGVAPDVIHTQRFPIGEDESWGTFFTPRSAVRYTVDFTVNEPDAAATNLDARLQVRGAPAPCS